MSDFCEQTHYLDDPTQNQCDCYRSDLRRIVVEDWSIKDMAKRAALAEDRTVVSPEAVEAAALALAIDLGHTLLSVKPPRAAGNTYRMAQAAINAFIKVQYGIEEVSDATV